MNKGVAVIGMAGRFPMAKNISEFYLNLRQGGNCVKPVSKQRRIDSTLPGKNYLPFGLLDDVDKFDFEFFGISQAEAELMDPNQRLMLEVVYEAIENAGYNFDEFSGSNSNVYYSCSEFVYHKLIEKGNPMAVTGNISALTAGRIARYFNLLGNALQIDTTCSSSLVSVHMACQELVRHQAEYALVCGSNVVLFPPVLQEDLDIGIIAPDGKAKAFDSRADGSSGGEAIACVLLKRVEDAQRDRDTIHAIIKGSAVNQDANRSSFLTAPSKIAQSEVITFAWKNSAVHPETISYIEAHGTGTKLGDPIEIDGLNQAFQSQTSQKHFCAVSSVKTNIGHTDRVAGLSGLIKTVLSLKHQELFPSLHFEEPNPHIDFENSAVYVNAEWKKWESSPVHPRRAGVSAFGLSGTNCHVVLEEAIPAVRAVELTDKAATPRLFCVSAKSKESLQENIRALYQHIGESNALNPGDISFTLNQGRKHFPYRYAFAATELTEIRQQLADGLTEAFTEERSFAYCPEKASELIFLFSVDAVLPESVEKALVGSYPAFEKAYRQCQEIVFSMGSDGKVVQGNYVQAFIQQYCLFKALEDQGIGSENLLGLGLGEVLVEVLMEELTLKEGLKQASQYQETKQENLAARLRNYVNREAARKKLLFAEVGNGTLSRTLLEIQTSKDNFSVSCLSFEQAEPVLALLKSLYLEGYSPDWKKIYQNQPVRRIELPTYHFQKSRAWAREYIEENKVNEWLYDITWSAQAPIKAGQPLKGQVLLLVMDKYGLGDELEKQLEKENTVIKLHLRYEYQQLGEKEYSVGIDSEEDYKKLEKSLVQTGFIITGIVGLNFYGGFPTHDTAGSIGIILKSGIYAQFHLLKAFSHYLSAKHFYVAFVSSHAHQVVENEEVIPTRSLASVFLKALLVEYPMLKVGSMDVAFNTSQHELLAEDIRMEISLEDRLRFVAYREQVRYVPSIHQLKASPVWLANQASFIQPNGVYLITGGASGIGYETAQLIAAQGSTHLIIIGRTELPPKATWTELSPDLSDDTISRVQNLKSLQNLGATVDYYAADVASEPEIADIFEKIKQEHGQLNGIIHSAGVPGKWQPFSHVSFDDFKATLSAKMVGTVNLDQASRSLKPDFFLAYSSLNSVVPQKHTLAYAVANAFEDAFALSKFNRDQRYLAIGWPGWYETGMSVAHGKVPLIDKNSPLKPLSTEDGLKALEYAFKINKPNIQVADIDLQAFAINPYFLVGEATSTGSFVPVVKEVVDVTLALDEWDKDFTETEAKLAAIWRDVLKVKQIRLEDDFFDLGGHSLNGTQVMNRIEKDLGVEVEFEALFDFSSIQTLAAHIDQMIATGNTITYEKITPALKQEFYLTSHAQRRLWFIHQYQPGLTAYNMPFAFELEGLRQEAFVKAFHTLEERHESLRTTFVNVDGLPKQKIHLPGSLGFQVAYTDLRTHENGEAAAKTWADEEAILPFDLEKGPLMRATLLQLGEERFVFLFTIHHIISDGWSLEVLVREVSALYQAYANGYDNPLQPLRVQYKDFVYWQNQVINEREEAFWLAKLAGNLSLITLPFDVEGVESNTFRGDRVHTRLNEVTTAGLRELALRHNSSLSNVILSVFNILLSNVSGQEDLLVGMAAANRSHLDTEGLIGFFVNTLIIRSSISEEMNFEDVLRQVTQNVVEAYQHQNYPFDLLVEKLNPERLVNRQAIFNVMYAFQNYADVALEMDTSTQEVFGDHAVALQGKVFDQEINNAYFDLTNFVSDYGNELLVGFNYNSDLFEKSTIEGLLDSYIEFLALTVSTILENANP